MSFTQGDIEKQLEIEFSTECVNLKMYVSHMRECNLNFDEKFHFLL